MSKPIIVAQIMGKWVGGGVESVVMNYYRHMDRSKIQFDFICDDDSTNIPYEEIKSLGGKVILVSRYQKLFKYMIDLYNTFKTNNYKIVHSHINTLSVFPLFIAKISRIPVRIAHSHSTTNQKELKKNIVKQILRPFSKIFATDYFCCSELAGRWLFGNKAYNDNKIYLLNNAIDIESFKYNEKIRKQLRKKFKIKDSTLVIGHVGRFVTQKNHDFLIDIFKEIYKNNSDSILILIGQGPLEENIKTKVKNLKLQNNVIFLGQINNVNDLYQVMDVFLLPSLYEGLPVVGIEAQTSGLFCIFSENMTKEAKILKSTKFLPLENNSFLWKNLILEGIYRFKRRNTTKIISSRGFNIKCEVIKLEKKYFELIDRRVI